jgi:hypothetical protein
MINAINSIASTLTNTAAPTDKSYLDAGGVKLLVDALKGDFKMANQWIIARDYAHSKGITSAMVKAGGEARVWFTINIVLPSFTAEQLKAHNAPKAALKGWSNDDPRRALRSYVATQSGSRLGKIARYLAELEPKADTDTDTDTDTDSEAKKVAPLADTLKKELTAMVVRIQKCEDTEGFDAGKLCKALTAAVALIR